MRPLLEGESVSYEFFHEDGKTSVHPTLGRLTVSDRSQRRENALADRQRQRMDGTCGRTNAIVEPLNRRGPRSLPIKNANWNKVTMKLTDERSVCRSTM